MIEHLQSIHDTGRELVIRDDVTPKGTVSVAVFIDAKLKGAVTVSRAELIKKLWPEGVDALENLRSAWHSRMSLYNEMQVETEANEALAILGEEV